MSPMGRESVRSTVICDPVVPESNIILVPLEADVELLRRGDDLVEVRDDHVALDLWDPYNTGNESWVEEEGLPFCDWVGADQRVFGDDGIPSYRPACGEGAIGLDLGRV